MTKRIVESLQAHKRKRHKLRSIPGEAICQLVKPLDMRESLAPVPGNISALSPTTFIRPILLPTSPTRIFLDVPILDGIFRSH